MSFAYQTLLLGPRGSGVPFFNCLRLTPCKWSRCQSPINQHLRDPASVADIVTEANPMLPHPPAGNLRNCCWSICGLFCEGKSGVGHCDGRKAPVLIRHCGGEILSPH